MDLAMADVLQDMILASPAIHAPLPLTEALIELLIDSLTVTQLDLRTISTVVV